MNPNNQTEVNHFKSLLRIRRAEEMIADEYRIGSMRTPTHFGIGQEAIAVGVCESLLSGDVVYSHHRSHTHYLAMGGSLLGLVAELMGKVTGCSLGRGGSVHLTSPETGFLGSSPILGHSIALAVGSALAFRMDAKKSIAVAFFGEGATDEGSVWESFNYASIRKLPVLFVCENNLYATESPMSVRQPEGTDLCDRLRSFKIRADRADGNDIDAVLKAAKVAIEYCRSGEGPVFLEFMTYRWREHVGPLWDYEVNRPYRTKTELEDWMQRCPVARAGNNLVAAGIATPADLEIWRIEIEKEVSTVIEAARQSAWPEVSTLFENIY